MSDVIWLGTEACHDPAIVGGKAANLSRLAAQFRVPPGFVITGLSATSAGLAAEVSAAVREAYGRLGTLAGESEPRVAVRSSALDEDGSATSFAGQHATFLNVRGERGVLEAVERCVASAASAAALAYRAAHELEEGGEMAVLVQQLVASEQSAVAFSAHPVTGARDEVVINASWGLGESVVSGLVTPDFYVVRMPGRVIETRLVADKQVMTVANATGTEEVPVPEAQQHTACLDDTQVVAIAELASDLAARMGWAVDIECAFASGELFLLQCRPITTLRA